MTVSVQSRAGSLAARIRLLKAAETCLRCDGYAALSTRAVAEAADMPLSQIHYHFGSKQGLVLALLDFLNERLVERQAATLGADVPLSVRWDRACEYLEADLASGYVRVLQEIIAAGYSDPELAAAARKTLEAWFVLLTKLAREAQTSLRLNGVFTAEHLGALVGAAFLGAESMILIGLDSPVRAALRNVGRLIWEQEGRAGAAHAR